MSLLNFWTEQRWEGDLLKSLQAANSWWAGIAGTEWMKCYTAHWINGILSDFKRQTTASMWFYMPSSQRLTSLIKHSAHTPRDTKALKIRAEMTRTKWPGTQTTKVWQKDNHRSTSKLQRYQEATKKKERGANNCAMIIKHGKRSQREAKFSISQIHFTGRYFLPWFVYILDSVF